MCERLKEILYERQRKRLSRLCFHWGVFTLKATTVTCSLSKIQVTGAINFTVMTILPATGLCFTMP